MKNINAVPLAAGVIMVFPGSNADYESYFIFGNQRHIKWFRY